MEFIGFFFALFIGFSIGLFGGGGSILSVPVLAYLFLLDEKISTAYSLFIVGVTALLGGVKQNFNKNVHWRTALLFGTPSVIGVWCIRKFVIPELPEILFEIGDIAVSRRMGMFGVLIILMFLASYFILNEKVYKKEKTDKKTNYFLVFFEGLIVGAVTGFVGAGGGFLIVPAFVLLINLNMKEAIGTSLVIIALKSIIGFFLGDAMIINIDWNFLILFTSITICGMFFGIYAGKFLNNQSLKRGFGYFVLFMAFFMLYMEF